MSKIYVPLLIIESIFLAVFVAGWLWTLLRSEQVLGIGVQGMFMSMIAVTVLIFSTIASSLRLGERLRLLLLKSNRTDTKLTDLWNKVIGPHTRKWEEQLKHDNCMEEVSLVYLINFDYPSPNEHRRICSVDLALSRWVTDYRTMQLFLRNVELRRANRPIERIFVRLHESNLADDEKIALVLQLVIGVTVKLVSLGNAPSNAMRWEGMKDFPNEDFVVLWGPQQKMVISEYFDSQLETSHLGAIYCDDEYCVRYFNRFNGIWVTQGAQEHHSSELESLLQSIQTKVEYVVENRLKPIANTEPRYLSALEWLQQQLAP